MGPAEVLGFAVGLVLLVAGAELLVRGASRIALRLGISPIIIGLTVVAWGTSTPELAVSVRAAVEGNADIALGNVVGSNIANVLLILGVSALILPLAVAQQFVRREVPIMVGAGVLTLVLALDGGLSLFDGALMLTAMVVYTVLLIRLGRRESPEVEEEYAAEFGGGDGGAPTWRYVLMVVGGLVLLVTGGRLLVDAATTMAAELGVSDLVIGLTVVAVGTSLPELATSVVAALRGERDIAVGNIVGSCIMNLLAILGVSAVIANGFQVSDSALRFDIPVMIAVSIACLPVFFTGFRIGRVEGGIFVAYYAAYATYLVLDSSGHDALPGLSTAMVVFVVPLTLLGLGASVLVSMRGRRRATPAG